ncbi:MAG: hypothetical protein K0Q57_1235 [Gammaproteobacteria bacterium]|jgi:hypothetical protein|nr:hypothetical protein [Gammaproteobacteria bacterium]
MNQLLTPSIAFVLSHVPFLALILAFIFGSMHALRRPDDKKEGYLSYLFLFTVGLTGIWGFVVHAFFPSVADKFIGWAYSPFEFEVAVANLGMGLTGVIAFRAGFGFRFATVMFVSCFSWGAAVGHLYQMLAHHNFAAGNAGLIFYTDIIIPLLLWLLLPFSKK